MGKRYYCDYCDKSFPYNTLNRKKHCDGSQHQSLKNSYYSQFKSLHSILEEDYNKKPCFKYFITNDCVFGSSCRFSHLPLDQLNNLVEKFQAENIEKPKNKHNYKFMVTNLKKKNDSDAVKIDTTTNKSFTSLLTDTDKQLCEKLIPKYKIPDYFKRFGYQIPPSLKPPNLDDYLNCKLNTWG